MESLKISVAIVTRGEVLIETMMCLIHALNRLSADKHHIHLNFRRGTYIHDLRNQCFQTALEAEADYLIFIDSDVTFEPDSISRLLESQKDVIGASYNMKGLPLVSTVKFIDENGVLIEKQDVPTDRPFKLFAVATGFMLIKMDSVKKLVHPFDFARNPDESLIGEDVNFCKRCRDELGLDIWCDLRIKVGHIGEYLY
jgi:glycosyltransferase involved in cell wall biosynthesis